MNWRLTTLLAVLIAVIGAFLVYRDKADAEPKPMGPANIVFVTGGSNPFWQKTVAGAKAAAEDTGAKLEVLMPEHDEDIEEQNRMLLKIDKDVVDGVAISPLNAEQQTRIISRLSQYALVVTFDSDAPLSTRMTYIGANNTKAGMQAAKLLKQAVPDGGKVVVVAANLTKDNMLERKQGFEKELAQAADANSESEQETPASDKYQIVDFVVDNGDSQACKSRVQKLLSAHPDLAAIVGMNARHGPVLVDALNEAGRLKEVAIIAFDDAPETLKGVEDGNIYATVVQDPYHYGFEAVRSLVTLHNRPDAQRPVAGSLNVVPIATQAVTQDNLEEFRSLQEGLAGKQ